MRNACLLVCLIPMFCYALYADTQDTVVFRTAMRPESEVPPVTSPGTTGSATITVNVTRDGRGNIDSASVTFEIDYTVAAATTFTGLHIHNAPATASAGVVIDTLISQGAPVAVPAGSGRITRIVNYTSADATGLRYVTGLLAQPELYYVNIHTLTNPTGVMRGQLLRSYLRFRPIMSSQFEVPPVNLDAEGAALVEVQVNRDSAGAITSGVVTFDVDYRFPAAVTITGLHIHSGAAGTAGSIVIDSGINNLTRAISNATRGNIFRVAEINSSDAVGIAALNGLMNDPTQYYINMHTTANGSGVIRGQLSPNVFVFFNQMSGAEEAPVPVSTNATANSMTYVRLDRDTTGNVVGGVVSFNLNYNMGGGPVTFTGLHIHNGKFGVSAGVVIDTQITQGSPVVDDDGIGSVNREVTINSSSTAAAFDSLRGLVENPENYYVNIHTSTNPSGIIRAQLARETYHFRAAMSAANEFPPIASTATATGWISARIARDGNGVVNGGTVTFDVNHVVPDPTTFTGLHIHFPGPAGTTGPVRIDTQVTAGAPVVSPTGSGNITRVVTVLSTDANALATLNALIYNPDQAYVNLHTQTNLSGLMRSQMLPIETTVAEAVGGGGWMSSVRISNPSAQSAVFGSVAFVQSNGTPMPEAVTDPARSFWIPAGGSTTLSMNNKAPLTNGFARVFSSAPVTVNVGYQYVTFPTIVGQASTVTARSVSIPVNVNVSNLTNTGIAIVAETAGNIVLTLNDSQGAQIAGGSVSIPVVAGQHIVGFVRDLIPGVTATTFSGSVTATANATSGTGSLSVAAVQFDTGLSGVTLAALP